MPANLVTPDGLATRERRLTVTPIKTAAYNAAPDQLVRVDIRAGSFDVNLPAASTPWRIVVKAVLGPAGSSAAFYTTACNVVPQGTDVINTGATSLSVRTGRSKTLISDGSGVITVTAGDTDATVEQAVADARYAALVDLAAETSRAASRNPIYGGVTYLDVNNSPNHYSYPAMFRKAEPRRRMVVRNYGPNPCQIVQKNTNNTDFNGPGWGSATTIAPGQEKVCPPESLTCFHRPTVSGNPYTLAVFLEAGAN